MRPFISRYPAFLAASPEFCDIQQALEPELLDLWTAWESSLDQLCVETATWGSPTGRGPWAFPWTKERTSPHAAAASG